MHKVIRSAVSLLALASVSADAASYDGSWGTTVQCPREPGGGEGYVWRFVSTVSGGRLHGQYGVPGQSPSATFDGAVDAGGAGSVTVTGISGSSKYNIANARGGSPIRFEATIRLAGTRGTGQRVSGRVCDLTFQKR